MTKDQSTFYIGYKVVFNTTIDNQKVSIILSNFFNENKDQKTLKIF